MSRRTGLALAALALAHPLAAQVTPPPVTAEEVLARAKEVYGVPDTDNKEECPLPKPGDEIVVCGATEDGDQYAVPSSSDLDPTGLGARGGGPRAPGVATDYPGAVAARGCFIPPCPPPMPELIDLKAIPEAPPGSDADLAARGEKVF